MNSPRGLIKACAWLNAQYVKVQAEQDRRGWQDPGLAIGQAHRRRMQEHIDAHRDEEAARQALLAHDRLVDASRQGGL